MTATLSTGASCAPAKTKRGRSTTGVMPAGERKANNEKFANDGSYASVEALLYKLAIKCFARVQAMGLSMEFADVLQEMNVGYVNSTQKWNSQGAAMFSTYCTTVCLNNFNHAIAKMERERSVLLISHEGEFTAPDSEGDDYDTNFMDNQPAPAIDSPEARLEGAQALQAKMESLSLGGKRLIALLLQTEQDPTIIAPRLSALARIARLEGAELRRVKIEILNTFGVSWK